MGKIENLSGKKYGLLSVIERAANDAWANTQWLCKCECGKTTIVRADSLKNGKTKSCGCILSKTTKKRFTIHGMYASRIYNCWKAMKHRCYLKSNAKYALYGARGIIVCEEWKNNFKAFYDWAITNGYSDNLTLDRIDSNGNYEPSNCRWATSIEQNNNTKRNHFVTYNNQTRTIAEWARLLNMNYSTLMARLCKGWSIEKAITTPIYGR